MKTDAIRLRLSAADAELVRRAAANAGKTVAAYARDVLAAEAAKQIGLPDQRQIAQDAPPTRPDDENAPEAAETAPNAPEATPDALESIPPTDETAEIVAADGEIFESAPPWRRWAPSKTPFKPAKGCTSSKCARLGPCCHACRSAEAKRPAAKRRKRRKR